MLPAIAAATILACRQSLLTANLLRPSTAAPCHASHGAIDGRHGPPPAGPLSLPQSLMSISR